MRGFDDHNTSGYHHDRRKQAVITAFVENPASRVLLRVSFVLCPLSLNVSSCVCVCVCTDILALCVRVCVACGWTIVSWVFWRCVWCGFRDGRRAAR